jgi:hypothetical protein
VRRFAIGLGLGAWALACGMVAATIDLSVPFAVGVGLLFFSGGVIGTLVWLRSRDDAPAERPAGKWR